MDKLEKVITKYVEAVTKHGVATDSGDSKTANRQFKNVEKQFTELKKYGDEGIQRLVPLLNNPNPYVRLWAASHLLEVEATIAKQVLLDLKDIKGSLVGFNADMVLKEWEKGNIKFY